jgi:hypothetical protein
MKAFRTRSIWSDMLKMSEGFINPFYDVNCNLELEPNYGIYNLRLWEECYMRYNLFQYNSMSFNFKKENPEYKYL